MVVPMSLVAAVLAVLANLVQTGPIFTFEPLKPKVERINPVAGFKRVFNKKMLFEAFKSLLKLRVPGRDRRRVLRRAVAAAAGAAVRRTRRAVQEWFGSTPWRCCFAWGWRWC